MDRNGQYLLVSMDINECYWLQIYDWKGFVWLFHTEETSQLEKETS